MRKNETEQCRTQQNYSNIAECEQCTINAQYTIIRERPTSEAQGELKGTNCMRPRGIAGTEPTQIRCFSRQSDGEAELCERRCKATQVGPSDSSPVRSDGSHDGQAGRLDCMRFGKKTLDEIT